MKQRKGQFLHGWKNSDIRINTVDGYQGQECDVMIMNCVRANSYNDIGFLKDYRRLNVAITRPKHFLFVIGSSSTLQRDPVWRQMVEDLKKRGGQDYVRITQKPQNGL